MYSTYTFCLPAGFIPPSSGTAYINGKDIRTDIDSVRESLGLCPQHNILFGTLTVEEHLIFFAKVSICARLPLCQGWSVYSLVSLFASVSLCARLSLCQGWSVYSLVSLFASVSFCACLNSSLPGSVSVLISRFARVSLALCLSPSLPGSV